MPGSLSLELYRALPSARRERQATLRKLVVDNFDVITRVLEVFAHAVLTAADVLGRIVLRVAQIEQLEHAWSGGDASLPFNAKAGPDASKLLLDFFARHQRRL